MENFLSKLADPHHKVKPSQLTRLSDLSSEELKRFEEVWGRIGLEKKRQIISLLVELAEDNPTLNFDNIFRFCLNDPDEEIRIKAIEGLSECEDPSLIEPLINLLQEDKSKMVRASAATALGKFVMLAETTKRLKPRHIAKLETALFKIIEDEAQPIEVKRRAIEAIAPLNFNKVKKSIESAYNSSHLSMKVSAIYAMGRNGDPYWLPIIIKELSSPYPEIRYEAVCACGEIAERDLLPHLTPLLRDDDFQVRWATVQALGKIGGNEAKKILLQYLNYAEESLRPLVIEVIKEIEAFEE